MDWTKPAACASKSQWLKPPILQNSLSWLNTLQYMSFLEEDYAAEYTKLYFTMSL